MCLFRRAWDGVEKMKHFLSHPTRWGVFLGKIENFSQKTPSAKQLRYDYKDSLCSCTVGIDNVKKIVKPKADQTIYVFAS
jgi:hypothetical protein